MRFISIILVLFVIIITSGCVNGSYIPYEFRQEFDQIVSIEIGMKEYGYSDLDAPIVILKTLEPSDHSVMIDAILEIPGQRITPPGDGFGPYLIVITYANGELEYLGEYNNGFRTPEGKIVQDSYHFNTDAFYELLSSYLGEVITSPTGLGPSAPPDNTVP